MKAPYKIAECKTKHKMKKLSMMHITGDIVPIKRTPRFSEYDNKPLCQFTHDDFASLCLDFIDKEGNMDENIILFKKFDIDYLKYIPKNYSRIYLYGVWNIIEEIIRMNSKKA